MLRHPGPRLRALDPTDATPRCRSRFPAVRRCPLGVRLLQDQVEQNLRDLVGIDLLALVAGDPDSILLPRSTPLTSGG